MSPAWLTHRQFLEVTAVQGVVQVLGDVFPGGKPVVSLLLPGVVMVSPRGGGERPPDLAREMSIKIVMTRKIFIFIAF